MLIEIVELTLSHLDLNCLTEPALMMLFGNAISHYLVAGRANNVHQITDRDGRLLYPGYFLTHLQVPPSRRLEEHRLWDQVAIGVDAASFGGIVVDSTYVLGKPGEIVRDASQWDPRKLPSMHAGSIFVIEGREGDPQPGVPKADMVVEMSKLTKPPETLARFGQIESRSIFDLATPALRPSAPLSYPLLTGRDIAPGHAVMFATFNRLMDMGERMLLAEHVWPSFPPALLNCLSLLEREIFYLGNCREQDVVRIDIEARLKPAVPSLCVPGHEIAGLLETNIELFSQRTGHRVAAARTRKMLAVPSTQKMLQREAARLLSRHGSLATS